MVAKKDGIFDENYQKMIKAIKKYDSFHQKIKTKMKKAILVLIFNYIFIKILEGGALFYLLQPLL